MKTLRVPEATITRISVYSRYLEQLDRKGVVTVSSVEIAEGVGVSPAQVRKDLAYFGEFRTQGVGYNVKDLRHYTSKILNLNEPWPLVVVGAGNLGFALSTYKGFNNRGFSVVGIFDNDLTKIGKKIVDLEVSPPEKMPEIIAQHKVKIGIIAFRPVQPGSCRPDDKKRLVGILNFAPVSLNVPDHIELRNVDLSVNLEILTFNLGMRQFASRGKE